MKFMGGQQEKNETKGSILKEYEAATLPTRVLMFLANEYGVQNKTKT